MPKGKYPCGFDHLQKGDLFSMNGTLRKARHVARTSGKTRGGALPEGLVQFVYVSINRGSWTNKSYTMLSRSELHQRFGGIVKRGVGLRMTETEARVQDAVEASVTEEVTGWDNTEIADSADGRAVA